MRSFISDYESLLKGFERFRRAAEGVPSPNPEDDDFARMAIVGYSMNAPTETWSRQHLESLRTSQQEDFTDEQLEFLHGAQTRNFRLFAALGLGYLLGLLQSGKMDETDFKTGLAQLPGFMVGAAGSLP